VPSSAGKELAVRGNECSVSTYRSEPVRSRDQIEKGKRLLVEFCAIESWDRKFSKGYGTTDLLGVLCRVRRRIEIISELTGIISQMKRKLRSQIGQTWQRSGLPKPHIRPSSFLRMKDSNTHPKRP
jgi:hypothetical protein